MKTTYQIFCDILDSHEVPLPTHEVVETYLRDIPEITDALLGSDLSSLGISREQQISDLMQSMIEPRARQYMIDNGYLQVAGVGIRRSHARALFGVFALAGTIPVGLIMTFMPWSFWWAGPLLIGANTIHIGREIFLNQKEKNRQ